MMVKWSLMMMKCSSMMVKWEYFHTLILPLLTSISPSLTSISPSLLYRNNKNPLKPSVGMGRVLADISDTFFFLGHSPSGLFSICSILFKSDWCFRSSRLILSVMFAKKTFVKSVRGAMKCTLKQQQNVVYWEIDVHLLDVKNKNDHAVLHL